ncbi:MAG: hypothetical protein VXY77_00285 [Pseudomonadota bacterium]|nr:hypothetical protein [Pseudomonadota bacterium]
MSGDTLTIWGLTVLGILVSFSLGLVKPIVMNFLTKSMSHDEVGALTTLFTYASKLLLSLFLVGIAAMENNTNDGYPFYHAMIVLLCCFGVGGVTIGLTIRYYRQQAVTRRK